ncbi:hypothetical protein VTO73DRAFT_15058 [Trametes versicolor]
MSTRPEDHEKFAKFRADLAAQKENGWDEAWKAKVTPWDIGTMQLALKELVEESGLSFPRSGRALVPGCGRGFDAIYISKTLGLETVGYDISPTGIAAANDLKASVGTDAANVKFEVADFFALEDEAFDLVYDYTFFVAIHPSQRPQWATQMAKLVKPGGFLITLVYPIKPYTDIGPPFFVRPEHYVEVLGSGWDKVWDKVPKKTIETHVGEDRMVVWRKL